MRILGAISSSFFLLLLGCAPPEANNVSGSGSGELDSLCRSVGNSADSQYCLTTFIQLLANPEMFDGRSVMFRGWILSVDGVVAIFPSKDAADAGELNASVVILSGTKREEMIALARSDPSSNPRMLTVGGKFHASGKLAREGDHLEVRQRFGSLKDVNELRP